MLRRKYFGLALLSLIIAVGSSSWASAVVKAGQSCTKAGISSTYKGVKYTCIKSGKKLVWNKGVKVIPVAKPTTPSIPSPQVTPTSIPSPIESPVAPVVTVQGKAMSEMKKSLSPSQGTEFFKFHYSPRADKTIFEFIESDLRRSIDY